MSPSFRNLQVLQSFPIHSGPYVQLNMSNSKYQMEEKLTAYGEAAGKIFQILSLSIVGSTLGVK